MTTPPADTAHGPRYEETFPTLTEQEIGRLKRYGTSRKCADGEKLFETEAYPGRRIARESRKEVARSEDVAVLLKLRSPSGVLSLLSTVTVFGTAVEVTLAELAVESFYPADEETARAMRTLASA